MFDRLYELKEYLDNHRIFFCFNGPVSQNLVIEIGDILEQKMNFEDTGKLTMIRVFSMVVEKAQNIIRYSDEKISFEGGRNGLSIGIIAAGYDGNNYFVLSGNIIRKEKVSRLCEKLTKLQGMDRVELKKYYKKQRKKGPDSDSKGAGLGFIDMAKKACRPIEFNFKGIDDEYSFFSMKTVIKKEK